MSELSSEKMAAKALKLLDEATRRHAVNIAVADALVGIGYALLAIHDDLDPARHP